MQNQSKQIISAKNQEYYTKRERKPTRHPNIIYKDGVFFVTTVVQHRVCCFGEVRDKKMILNTHGEIVRDAWLWLFEQYPYTKNHAFVLMPNHFHGVIEILNDGKSIHFGPVAPVALRVQKRPKPLSELIGAFKTRSSKYIHQAGFPEFKWHNSFHDHKMQFLPGEYENIVNYIHNNPAQWKEDKFWTE